MLTRDWTQPNQVCVFVVCLSLKLNLSVKIINLSAQEMHVFKILWSTKNNYKMVPPGNPSIT